MSEETGRPAQRRIIPTWLIPLMIGIVTVTAGVVTWRAGQLGSSAAFEDRQAVGQTIRQQEIATEARLGATAQASDYMRYLADFSEAEALDGVADDLEAQGATAAADATRTDADDLRTLTSRTALAARVFSRQQILRQQATDPTEALPFDIQEKVAQLEAEAQVGLDAPGVLEPDVWAERANDTRDRVRALRLAALGLLAAVVAYTIAQLADRRIVRWIGAGVGTVLYVGVTIAAFAGPY